jgi:hypothetical protein
MAEASGSVKGFSIERSLYQNKWLGNPNDLVLIFGCLAEIANDALSDEPKDRAFAADFLEENIPRISSLFGLEKDQELPIEASLLFQDVYAVGDGSIVPANVRSSLQFARNEGEIDISDYEPNIADFEPDDEDTDPSVTENPHSTAFHQDLSLLLNEAVLCPEGKPIIISDWNIELGAFGEYLLTMGQIYQSIFVEKIPQDRYARDLEISLDIIKNAIREIIKVAKKTQFELEYA